MRGMKKAMMVVAVILLPAIALAAAPTLVQQHYRWRNDNGSETAATWKASANATISSVARGENIRLRFCVAETGTAGAMLSARVEYAEATGGPWTAVGTEGNGATAFEMTLSPYYADGAATTKLLAGTGAFVAGKMMEKPSNISASISLTMNYHTNVEYCFQATAKAQGSKTYYFRVINNAAVLTTYSKYAQLTMAAGEANEPPQIVSPLAAEASMTAPFTYTIQASGSEPITYGASGLPPGLSRSGDAISGQATAQGTFNVALTASNAYGADNETLVLTVLGNVAPVANNQNTYSIIQGGEVLIYLSWSDVDTPLLADHTFAIVSQPAHGTLESYNARHGYTQYGDRWYYRADGNYTGPDPFTWTCNDGDKDSNVATCTVTVNGNTPPVANNQSVTLNQNVSTSFYLSKTDSDAGQTFTYTLVSGPSHGSLVSPSDNNRWTYTSQGDYAGPDSFTWKCNDGADDSNTATCSITVKGVPPAPQNQTAAVAKDTSTDLTPYYTGGGGFTLTFVDRSSSVTVVDDKFRFTPAAGFTGITAFTWYITYSNASTPATNTATATCTIHVMEDTGNADWPQWRHDENRTGVTLHELPVNLYLQWQRDIPTAANVNMYSLHTDADYCRPVQLGGTLFVPVMGNDSLVAYDTATGAEKWRFYASGMVRRPPAAVRLDGGQEVVILGSDDGHIYGLDAADGSPVWTFRAAPNNKKAMGFGRLSSVWPVWCSPTVYEGKVYFVAGILPSWLLYAYCLDAATGDVVWVNDGQMFDWAGETAIGPPTFSYDHTLIYGANGQATAWAIDAATGEPAGRAPGGRYAYYVDGNGRNASGSEISGNTYGDYYGTRSTEPMSITAGSRMHTRADMAGLGVVGTVSSILAGDDKLFVTTTGGGVYCFGGTQVTPGIYPYETTPLPNVSDKWTTVAGSLLSRDDLKQGLALVWGVGSGRLVEELAKQGGSGLMVVAVDPDPAKLRTIRDKMDGAGWSGTRVSTLEGNPMDFRFAPYTAVIIASEDANVAGIGSGSDMLKKIHKYLRPFGGEAWIPTTDAQHADMEGWLSSAADLSLCEIARKTGFSGAAFTQVKRTGLSDEEQVPKPPYGVIAFSMKNKPNLTYNRGTTEKGVRRGHDTYSWLPFTASEMPGYEPPAPEYNNVETSMPRLPATRVNTLYSRTEKQITPSFGLFCGGGPLRYGSLGIAAGKGVPRFYDASRYVGLAHFFEGGGCNWTYGAHAGNGVVMLSKLGPHGGTPAEDFQIAVTTREDEENTTLYQSSRGSARIEEEPVKRVAVNLGGVVDRFLFDEQTLWTHHPAAHRWLETPPLIPVTYRGAAVRRYHHSAQMESSGKGWVCASTVEGMDGMSAHLIQPVVATSASSAPVIDGDLSDGCWDGTGRLNIVPDYRAIDRNREGGFSMPRADDHGYAILRYDNANLYIAAGLQVAFPEMSNSAKYIKIVLAGREDPNNTVIFTCDANGTSSEGLDPAEWTGGIRLDGADPITVEIAVPWSALESIGIWKEQMLFNVELCKARFIGAGFVSYSAPAVGLYLTPLYLDAERGPATQAKAHTVRLYFAEMEGMAPGERRFDVKLQGNTVLSNLDVILEAGGPRRGLVKEFTNVMIADKLDIDFTHRAGEPMLSGVEIVGTYAHPANVPPVAQIEADRVSGAAPLAVDFSARGSYDPDGQIPMCAWDFGDGALGQGARVRHVFAEPGSYTVDLMVLDDRGAAGTARMTVNVVVGAPAAFVCKIRASSGDYTTLSAWEAAIESDLTSTTSRLFRVTSRGNYDPVADDGLAVIFSSGGTGMLKHMNTANVAYITDCAGTIGSGTVTCSSGHTFTVSGSGSRIYTAVAEGYNDWPVTGLEDSVTLSGWVTDPDHGILIRSAPGHGHNGVITDASGDYTGFALNAVYPNPHSILDEVGNTRISGIIIARARMKLGDNASVSRVICRSGYISVKNGSTVANSLGIGASIGTPNSVPAGDVMVVNCTAVNGNGFSTGNGKNNRVWFVNCLARPSGTGKGFSLACPESCRISYCASSDGTADDWDDRAWGYEGNRVDQAFTFADESADNYRLAASDAGARGWGTAGLGADIEGEVRQAPYDIGMDGVSGGNIRPAAVIAANPVSGTVPLTVSFSGSGSSDPDGTIVSYAWNFGPSTGSGQATSYTYTSAGTYTATLTVTDNDGATGTATKSITVTEPASDNDGDGIPDAEDPDDDNDGMPDVWETANSLNPLDAADASLDADGDGMLNLEEYIAGTNPRDNGSWFMVNGLMGNPPSVSLSFDSVTGRLYDVEHCDDLTAPNWNNLTSDLPGTGNTLQVDDPAMSSRRFYRIRVRLP